MNKNVFIVSTYPSDNKRMEVLKEVLENLRSPDFDIILVSNFKIEKSVFELADYL